MVCTTYRRVFCFETKTKKTWKKGNVAELHGLVLSRTGIRRFRCTLVANIFMERRMRYPLHR